MINTTDLPKTLWDPTMDHGISNIPKGMMHLPFQLSNAYRESLQDLGLLERAQDLEARQSGGIGGSDTEDSQAHFAENFSGSCGRAQLFAIDPHLAFKSTRKALLSLFSGGYVTILDIPSGAGSGSATLIALVSELRSQGVLPSIDLDIRIVGGDISQTSRDIANLMFAKMKDEWLRNGISVNHQFMHWDVLNDESTGDLIEAWEDTFDDRDGLLLVSNFSGFLGSRTAPGQSRCYIDEAESPLRQIMTTVSRNLFTTFWLEPSSKSAERMMTRLDKIVCHYSRIKPTSDAQPRSSAALKDPVSENGKFAVRATGIHLIPAS